ncbi:MAG: hypothetical protein AB7U29_15570 [Desulfobulbus sp.]
MPHTNRSDPAQNPHYPRFVSPRADELIDELEPGQVVQLRNALHTQTLEEWMCWFEDSRESICEYDRLTPVERRARLLDQIDIAPLMLHHACVFLELWRKRVELQYYCLHRNDLVIEHQPEQREMIFSVLEAYNHAPVYDYWPFGGQFPFRIDP